MVANCILLTFSAIDRSRLVFLRCLLGHTCLLVPSAIISVGPPPALGNFLCSLAGTNNSKTQMLVYLFSYSSMTHTFSKRSTSDYVSQFSHSR